MYRYTRVTSLLSKCLMNRFQNVVIRPGLAVTRYFNGCYETSPIMRVNLPGLQFVRYYAKSKDKKKEKGKTKVHIDEAQLAEILNVESMKTEMTKHIETLKSDYAKNLSLRSAAGSIESLPVNLDGKEYSLQELAQIVRKNPKTIIVNLAAFPQAIPAAVKAIQKSGMNLNPQQDGTTLYIPVPKVTKEYREQLAKSAKQLFIKCRDNIKDVQNRNIKALKKKQHASEDLIHSVEVQVITLADNFVAEAQKILDSKQTELVGTE